MEVQIGIITRWDNVPTEDFPHEYSSWVDGGAVNFYRGATDLTRQKYEGIEQTRTVTTEGLHGPVAGLLTVAPPKYPPVRVGQYNCDSAAITLVQGNAQYMVLSVDDIGNGVPPAAENRSMNDPLPDTDFNDMAAKIEALTRNEIGDDEADLVASALTYWRTAYPQGTPYEFYLALRRFTS